MSLGTRIKECRLRSRLSQEKVAELVGVSRQAVTKWECDQSAPNTDNLFKLAEVLGTTVDFLITSETDNRSVAEQVYQMFKEDAARKEAERKHQKNLNIRSALLICAGYLLIYLTGKIILWDSSYAFFYWLTAQRHTGHSYLFGWLLSSKLGFFALALSALCGLFGFRRIGFTTLAGFAIGLPLGECLGGLPILVAEGYHYGWAIWGGIYLGSLAMGIWLQRFKPEELTFGCKKLRLWCIICIGVLAIVIAFVLLSVPAYARPG